MQQAEKGTLPILLFSGNFSYDVKAIPRDKKGIL
jgi:hypothetical protein